MVSKSSSNEKFEDPQLHGDVLETIFSHVPLINLVSASHVSKGWKAAVFFSLRHVSTPKPWLLVHTQSRRSHVFATTRGYDPRSDTWVRIESGPSIKHGMTVRSNGSNLVYAISSSKFLYSIDPFHLTWHHVGPPKVWRVDPIVAAVGRRIIVAGCTYDFEEDQLAVEMYDPDSATWTTCESMPDTFKHSSSSIWVSAVTDGSKLFVTEKQSGVMHVFDPNTKAWSGPLDLHPDRNIFYYVTAFVNNRLILIGIIEDGDDAERVKLWGMGQTEMEEIGEVPKGLLEREDFPMDSINVCSSGNFLYIYNIWKLAVCEFVCGKCRWQGITMMGLGEAMERVEFSCSEVGIEDIHKALRSNNRRFQTIE